MVHKRTLALKETDRDALIAHRDHDGRPQVRQRCATLLKIADGQSAYQVARHGLLKPHDLGTVCSWPRVYQTEGLNWRIGTVAGRQPSSFSSLEKLRPQSDCDGARTDTSPLDTEARSGHVCLVAKLQSEWRVARPEAIELGLVVDTSDTL